MGGEHKGREEVGKVRREGRKGREGEGREEGREGRREGGERLTTAQIVHKMKAVQLVWTSYHTFTYQSQ